MTPLHYIGNMLRQLLEMIPLGMVRSLFVASLGVVLLWVMTLPRSETRPAQATGRWDENLKLSAGLALLIQIVIYSLL